MSRKRRNHRKPALPYPDRESEFEGLRAAIDEFVAAQFEEYVDEFEAIGCHHHPGHPHDDTSSPKPEPSKIAVHRARVAATRRQDPDYVYPHDELASALGLPRHIAAALVVLGVWDDEPDGVYTHTVVLEPDDVADLSGRLLYVQKHRRQEIIDALAPGGLLVTSGLFRPTTHPDQPTWFAGTTGQVAGVLRLFLEGHPHMPAGVHLVRPDGQPASSWVSVQSASRIRSWRVARRRLAQMGKASELPTAGLTRLATPLELSLPEGIAGEAMGACLANALGRPVIDARGREATVPRSELIALARLHRATLLLTAEPTAPERRSGFSIFDRGHHRPPRPAWPAEVDVVYVGSGRPQPGAVELEPPNAMVRASTWSRAGVAAGEPTATGAQLEELAQVPLHPEQIVEAVARCAMDNADPLGPRTTPLEAARRAQRLDGPPTQVSTLRLDDLVLSPELREQVDDVVAACRGWQTLHQALKGSIHGNAGHTPVILCWGPPGTGKTLFAQVLANETANPCRSLSAPDLLSCWVGESENRIRREFRRADGAVLFLDEVDALLGARGSGPQAHHSDKLVNVLLEELEKTRHVTVMATNLPDGLDPALDRRVLFRLHFAPPGSAERESLWRLHLPEAFPGASSVDCHHLARHALSGGGIKNASYRALLKANRDDAPLTTARADREALLEARRGGNRRAPAGFGGSR